MSNSSETPGIESLAARHELPVGAVHHLLDALIRGGGRQAQFNHPALGGMGEWNAGGMIMIGDMFNEALKAKVAALCADLVLFVGEAGGSQPHRRWDAWWPQGLGFPASSGAQNDVRYAVFPEAQRLALQQDGEVTLYDTGEHRIGGVSQEQGSGRDLSFTSQFGAVWLHDLRRIDRQAEAEKPSSARAPAADIASLIERLGALHAKGLLTDAEFSAKKAELLGRL